MTRSIMVLLFLAPAIAAASEDPIKTKLDKARARYTENCDDAKAKFLTAMEAKLKEVGGRGDLNAALQVKAQKEMFEKDGTLPNSPRLSRPVADYESNLRAAREALRKAIEKAKDSYTKELKLDDAESLATELKELSAVARKGASDSTVKINAMFSEGSVWKGIVKEVRGDSNLSFDLVIAVTAREGPAFEGSYQLANGKFVYLIEGSILKDQLDFKITKIQQPNDAIMNNLIGLKYKGRILLDPKTKKPTLVTSYTWQNSNNTRPNAHGTGTLVLEE